MRKIFGLFTAFLLSGCYSLQGSERVLGRDARPTNEVASDSIFSQDFKSAYEARVSNFDVEQDKINAMMSSGFTHIYSFCDNYFDAVGAQQRKSRVVRDSIAPLTALITGVIALQKFDVRPGEKQDILAGLGLFTAVSSSAIDIYDEHMLFGAENIGAVETLTLSALNEHSARVMEFDSISFDAAIKHLLKNQSICSPQHILSLTREAIKEGKVQAATSSDDVQGSVRNLSQDGNKSVEVTIEND